MAEKEPKKVTETVFNVSEPSLSPPTRAEKAAEVVAQQETPVSPPPVLPSPPALAEEKLEGSKALVPVVVASKIL